MAHFPFVVQCISQSSYFDKKLSTFRSINSRLQGHPTKHMKGCPVFVCRLVSLGQGLSVAIGAAQSKLNNDSSIVYSLHGDGELQEGQIWETMMYAAAKKLITCCNS